MNKLEFTPYMRFAACDFSLSDEKDQSFKGNVEKGTAVVVKSAQVDATCQSGIALEVSVKAQTGLSGDEEIYETVDTTIDAGLLCFGE